MYLWELISNKAIVWKSETSVCTSDAAEPNAAMLVHTWCLNLLPMRDSRSGKKKNLLKEKVLKQLVSDRGWADIAAPRPTSKKNGLWIMQSESIESRIENIALDASVLLLFGQIKWQMWETDVGGSIQISVISIGIWLLCFCPQHAAHWSVFNKLFFWKRKKKPQTHTVKNVWTFSNYWWVISQIMTYYSPLHNLPI